MSRPTYSPDLRAEVVALAVEVGPKEAARVHGVPHGTVKAWCARGGVATERNGNNRNAVEAGKLRWEERRINLAHEIGDVAQKALDRTSEDIDAGNARQAQSYATTMAILVDKAQLLSGGATGRIGSDTERGEALGAARDAALRLVS